MRGKPVARTDGDLVVASNDGLGDLIGALCAERGWTYSVGVDRSPTLAEARHDLVVIGASAGGVQTLRRVVAGFPADLPATICIVVHIAPTSPSALAQILGRAGPLPCRAARDGEPLRLREILVAPPNHHLEVEDSHVRLTTSPAEHGHRPSVDALFRSASAAFNSRVVGVVLSGSQDDGAAGLAVIKSRGGAAVVQDPAEALYAGMPSSAIANVGVDAIVPSRLVAGTVIALVRGEPLPAMTPDRRGESGDSEHAHIERIT